MEMKFGLMVRGVAGMVKTALPFCLLTLLPFNVYAQQLSVKNEVIDCGNVIYEQPVTAKFEMQNMSSNPISIKDVKTSCGCTTVEYPKGQIAPGESFVVNATYDSRQMGHFFKDIALYSDASQQPFYLQIRGVVVEEIIDFAGQYPYTIADLNVDRNDVEFDDVNRGDRPVQKINIRNASSKSVSPVVMHLPSYMQAQVSPTTLQPGRQGTISLILDSKKVRDYGLTQTSVFLGMYPGDKVHPDKEISVSTVLLPAFTEMTETQMQYAPKLGLSAEELNIAFNGKAKKTETIIIENLGRSELDISSLQMFTSGMKVKLNKTKLQSGEQAKLKITVDAKEIKKARSKPRVLMITNDPKRAKVIINVNVN
jgi:hypothetical protein